MVEKLFPTVLSMVWVNPTEARTVSNSKEKIWPNIQEEMGFINQRYDATEDFYGATPPYPFRILFHTGNQYILIAQDKTEEAIQRNWEWLENNLFPLLQDLLEDLPEEEVAQFAILKISTMIQCTELEDTLPVNHLDSPEAFYTSIYPKELLIAYYPCCMWEQMLFKGILFISVKHCFFFSEAEHKSVVILNAEISNIEQQRSGPVLDSLQICTIHDEKFLFSNFAIVEEVFDVVNGLREFRVFEVLNKIEGEMEALNREIEHMEQEEEPLRLETPSEYSSFVGRFSFDKETVSIATLRIYAQNNAFQRKFRLPNTETLISKAPCVLAGWKVDKTVHISGVLYISKNFLAFHSSKSGNNEILAVIATACVTKLEAVNDKIVLFAQDFLFTFENIKSNSVVSLDIQELWEKEWKHTQAEDHSKPDSPRTSALAKEKLYFQCSEGNITTEQQTMWKEYIKNNGIGLVAVKTPELVSLIRSGLPRRLRGMIWRFLSGALYKEHLWPQEYKQILKDSRDQVTLATEEIERDIGRTFPEHPYFQVESGKQCLKRILTTYAFRNPSIGYCQSMNMVCGFQMLFMPEDKAYWMLSSICEDLLPEYYVPSMIGTTTDQVIFEYLIQKYFPDIHEHFISLSIPLTLITIPWLLCIYVGLLSWETTLRILDCFFGCGKPVLFQIGLAIFKIHREKIMECDDGTEVVELFKKSKTDCETIFQVAFSDFGHISATQIHQWHREFRAKVVKDLRAKLERRKEMAAYYKAKKEARLQILNRPKQPGEEAAATKAFSNNLFLAQTTEALENFSKTAFTHTTLALEAFENLGSSEFVAQTSEALENFGNTAKTQASIAFDNFSRFAQTTLSNASVAVNRLRTQYQNSDAEDNQ